MKLSLPRLRRRAFTLLELLVVVVVIGILATLALVRFGNVQEKAYRATMQSDLRNFATARSIHIAEDGAAIMDASSVAGYSFSDFVFDAGYQGGNATEWALLVGHNKTETKCLLSTLASNGGTHRIECSEDGNLTFDVEAAGSIVDVDASDAIAALAFGGESSAFAALAASDADIALISWNWGDGSPVTSGTPATAKTAQHTYADGDYTITLTLVKKTGGVKTGTAAVEVGNGGGGGGEEEEEVTPPANVSPTNVSFTSPTSPAVGSALSFLGSATDSDGTVVSYAWNFGDGGTWSGASAQHVYSTAGTYQVTLTVTDDDGATAQVSNSITVGAPAAGTPLYNTAVVPNFQWWGWNQYQSDKYDGNPAGMGFSTVNGWAEKGWGAPSHGVTAGKVATQFILSESFQTYYFPVASSTGGSYRFKITMKAYAGYGGQTLNLCADFTNPNEIHWSFGPGINATRCPTGTLQGNFSHWVEVTEWTLAKVN